MFKLAEWPADSVPKGAFTDPQKLGGRVLKSNLLMGEPVSEIKLAPAGTLGGLSALITEGKRAITVRVNDVIGVAGFALPGNYVDIIVSTQKDAGPGSDAREQNISKIVLERILVLAVAQEVNRDETKPKVVNAVTLEVTPEQAEKLDLARSVGTLSLALRNQIDPQSASTTGATKLTLLPQATAPAASKPAPSLRRPCGRWWSRWRRRCGAIASRCSMACACRRSASEPIPGDAMNGCLMPTPIFRCLIAAGLALAAAARPAMAAKPVQADNPAQGAPGRAEAGPRCQGEAAKPAQLSLQVGKSNLMRLPEAVQQRSVGNPGVVQALLVAPDTLYIAGVDVGTTNMIVQGKSGLCSMLDITVAMDPAPLQATLAAVMPEERDIKVLAPPTP
jgi:Flp pilus assembly protein CpaB